MLSSKKILVAQKCPVAFSVLIYPPNQTVKRVNESKKKVRPSKVKNW
jgi:hypothetical protein